MTSLAPAASGAASGVFDGAPTMPLPVLMYHGVGDSVSADFRRWELPPGAFAEQLEALAESGYHLTGLTDALAHPARRQVVITFENGFEDFVTTAVPALRAIGASATLYVPTAFVGRRATWLDGYTERNLLCWTGPTSPRSPERASSSARTVTVIWSSTWCRPPWRGTTSPPAGG